MNGEGRKTENIAMAKPLPHNGPMAEAMQKPLFQGLLVLGVSLLFYSLSQSGAIRSPDGETVFSSCVTLLQDGTLAQPMHPELKTAGLAWGEDSRLYPVFGPLQSLAAAPLTAAGVALADRGFFDTWQDGPVSYYVGSGVQTVLMGAPRQDPRGHGVRFVASLFNVLVSGLTVLAFWLALLRLQVGPNSRLATSLLLAFGTLLWPYSATFFSEPLALLFTLLSFAALLPPGPHQPRESLAERFILPAVSGLLLGLAVAAHISAALFAPFFVLALAWAEENASPAQRATSVAAFCLGLALPLSALGWYNLQRFGSVLETGRFADPDLAARYGYGHFVWPFMNLYRLLLSSAKGLVLFCPAAVAGLFFWHRFAGRSGRIALVVLLAVAFRLVFIACRSDWHGGFSPGPRYLLMAVPFLLIPLAMHSDFPKGLDRPPKWWYLLMAAAVTGQVYLWLFDSFAFSFMARNRLETLGFDAGQIFDGYELYTNAAVAPYFNLDRAPVAALWWRHLPMAPRHLWFLLSGVTLAVVFGVYALVARVNNQKLKEAVESLGKLR